MVRYRKQIRRPKNGHLSQDRLLKRITLLEKVLENALHGVLVTDVTGIVHFHNEFTIRLWNLPVDAFASSQEDWKLQMALRLKDQKRWLGLLEKIFNHSVGETLDIHEMNDGRLLECRSHLFYLEGSQQTYRIWSFRDCTEQQRRENELQHRSTHDTLTGVYNRAYFEAALRQCRSSGYLPIGMIMIDVDGLKKVNDRLGHGAGDVLLCQAGSILRQACRVEDVVARLGGDEFGVLLMRSDQHVADQVMDRIQGLLNLYNIRHLESPISLSLGAAVAFTQSEADDIVLRADETMYRERWKRRSQQSPSLGELRNRSI